MTKCRYFSIPKWFLIILYVRSLFPGPAFSFQLTAMLVEVVVVHWTLSITNIMTSEVLLGPVAITVHICWDSSNICAPVIGTCGIQFFKFLVTYI